MMTSKFVAAAVLAAALAVPGSAQSASELLQKGIYTQETAGDLDGAIQIYRQIVASGPAQHEIAAEAQYRMAEALVRKGDLTGAALEFQKLARDYSEYQALISRMAATPVPVVHAAVAPPASTEFEVGTPVSVSGTVTQVLWMNPRAWVHVKDGIGTDWSIQLPSPNQLVRQGVTRASLKLGDQVTVNASPAKDGSKTALAETVYGAGGTKIFDRASIGDTSELVDRSRQLLEQVRQALQDAK
jgi:tetratricopeptide (TPR) repeat protein